MNLGWKSAAFISALLAAGPSAALGASHLRPWTDRMIAQGPTKIQPMTHTTPLGQMMNNPPPGMERMAQAPGVQQMMGDDGH